MMKAKMTQVGNPCHLLGSELVLPRNWEVGARASDRRNEPVRIPKDDLRRSPQSNLLGLVMWRIIGKLNLR